jgi:S-adenosylmethionine uptake transporter
MLVASALFAVMGLCVKLAAPYFSTGQIVGFRGLIGLFVVLTMVRWQWASLKTLCLGQHLWRGFFGVTALWLWYQAMTQLPLAMSMTLNYTSALWLAVFMMVLAWWHKKRGIAPGFFLTLLMGFIGIVLLLQPTMQADQFTSAIMALSSGFLAGLAYLQVRQLGQRGESEFKIVFYLSLICTLAGFLFSSVQSISQGESLIRDVSWTWLAWAAILGVGISAALAQLAMTRAYRLGNPLLVANLQYTGIVFSTIFDLWIWELRLDWISWLGISVILLSAMLATYYNSKLK